MKFKLKKRTRFYFYNLFLKIALFSLLIIVVLTITLYFNFRSYGLDIVNKSNEKVLVQLSNNLLQVNNYAKLFAASLYQNTDATDLMYYDNLDIVETMRATTALDQLIKGIPFIHSIYIYNGKTQTYYSMGPNRVIRKKGEFYDNEIVKIIDGLSSNHNFSPMARHINVFDLFPGPSADVFTYINSDFFSSTTREKSSIVLNIKLDWVYDTLVPVNDKMTSNSSNNIIIIDKKGLVLGHSLKTLYLKNLSDKAYVKNILKSNSDSGFFVSDNEGVRSVITYVYIKDLDWYMLSITPYNYIASSIMKVKNFTLLICLLLAILVIFLAFLLSKQLYSPIQLLWHRTEQLMGKQHLPQEQHNELDTIESYVSKATNRIAALESFKNTNLYQLKEEVLKKLLLNILEDKKAAGKLKEVDIQLVEESSIILILFKIDHFSDFKSQYNESDQALYKFALSNIALEILRQYWKCESMDMGNDQLAILLNVQRETDDEGTPGEALIPFIKEIQQLYQQYFHISISAFISNSAQGFNAAHTLYNNVLSLSNYRITHGFGCILCEEDISSSQTGRFDINNCNISNLIDSLKLGKPEVGCSYLDQIISGLHSCEYNVIMFTLSFISSSMFHALSLIEKNSMLLFGIDFVSFNNRLSSLETLEEIKAEYMSLFNLVIEKMNQRKEQNIDILILKTVEYIGSNYHDKNLCTDVLADIFNLTSAYLGKLFRESTSKSIADYLTEVRLTKAKELLESGLYSIDRIVEKIGWENKKYFYTIFKKNFGVTPTEYRLKYKVTTQTAEKI